MERMALLSAPQSGSDRQRTKAPPPPHALGDLRVRAAAIALCIGPDRIPPADGCGDVARKRLPEQRAAWGVAEGVDGPAAANCDVFGSWRGGEENDDVGELGDDEDARDEGVGEGEGGGDDALGVIGGGVADVF
jgi:hypothetical protein